MPPTPMVQIKTRFLGAGPRVEYSCDGLRDIPVRGNLAIPGLLSGPGAWNQNFKDWRDLILNSFPELFSNFSRNPQSYSQKIQGIPRAIPKISRAIPKIWGNCRASYSLPRPPSLGNPSKMGTLPM